MTSPFAELPNIPVTETVYLHRELEKMYKYRYFCPACVHNFDSNAKDNVECRYCHNKENIKLLLEKKVQFTLGLRRRAVGKLIKQRVPGRIIVYALKRWLEGMQKSKHADKNF